MVVRWQGFTPSDFEYDFENDKLAAHGVTFDEAVNVSFPTSRFGETRNTKIATNLSGRLWAGEDSRLFFNLNPATLSE